MELRARLSNTSAKGKGGWGKKIGVEEWVVVVVQWLCGCKRTSREGRHVEFHEMSSQGRAHERQHSASVDLQENKKRSNRKSETSAAVVKLCNHSNAVEEEEQEVECVVEVGDVLQLSQRKATRVKVPVTGCPEGRKVARQNYYISTFLSTQDVQPHDKAAAVRRIMAEV